MSLSLDFGGYAARHLHSITSVTPLAPTR